MTGRTAAALLLTLCLTFVALADADVVQQGQLRVSFVGEINPHALPRRGKAPIEVTVGTKIVPTEKEKPPRLRSIEIAINRNGALDTSGLPVCPLEEVQPATTTDALRNCRGSLVGEGQFSAEVLLKGQASLPSAGKLYAFNSRVDGRPAILAHVYGKEPAPASFTLVFEVRKARGTFGTVLKAALPDLGSDSGYVTGLSMTLGKVFSFRGRRQSYLTAGCPAPRGLSQATFAFARANLAFTAGKKIGITLVRSCGAR